MKVNELEKELGISRSNIRFYEKNGLLNPVRNSNGYRDYSDEEVQILKKIVIMRKLGLSVATINNVLSNRITFIDALKENDSALSLNISELSKMIDLNDLLIKDNASADFDVDYYWELIKNEKSLDNSFAKHDRFIKWYNISNFILLVLVCVAPILNVLFDYFLLDKGLNVTGLAFSLVTLAILGIFTVKFFKKY